jgi:glycosyltransferase involved in cell wall biosynthesis
VKHRLIIVGPVPPPAHGVAVSTLLLLENPCLCENFDVEHLNTSDHRSLENLGTWEATNAWLGLRHLLRLAVRLNGRRGILYLPLSQSTPALLRDCLFVLLGARRGWRVATRLEGSELGQLYEGLPWALRIMVKRCLAMADSVAVLGENLRGVLAGLVDASRIVVVPNGAPDMQVGPVERDRSQVLFLSNFLRRKGILEALDAARLVLTERPDAHFVFTGAFDSESVAAEAAMRSSGFGGRIEFREPVQGRDRDQLLRRSAIMLFPPVGEEGHPRVVLEAMAAGLPVVTTDRGAISESVIDGVSGFVLKDPVPAELATRLLLLLSDESLHSQMAHQARARYLKFFTQDQADRNVDLWLRSVADRGPCLAPWGAHPDRAPTT